MKLRRRGGIRNPAPLPLWQWAENRELLHPNPNVEHVLRRKHGLPPLRARLVANLAGLGVRHD